MEKVYLLLRDNIESGPYTIQELLQKQLKPTDMFWIEGKSTAWTYLNELELNFHVEEKKEPVENTQQKRKYVDEIEQKAEEIRKRALSYHTRPSFRQQDPASGIHSASPAFVLQEDTIEIVNHKKEKNKTLNEVLVTGLIVAVFAGGLYAGGTFLQNRKEIISPAAIQITPSQQTVNKSATTTARSNSTPVAIQNDSLLQEQPLATFTKEKPKTNPGSVSSITDTQEIKPVKPEPVTAKLEQEYIPDAPVKIISEETPAKVETPKKTQVETEKKPEATKSEVTEETEKKKGFLKGIFKKKKKDDKDEN